MRIGIFKFYKPFPELANLYYSKSVLSCMEVLKLKIFPFSFDSIKAW